MKYAAHRLFLSCLILLPPAAALPAEYPEITATVTPVEATVGTPLVYTVTLRGEGVDRVTIRPPVEGPVAVPGEAVAGTVDAPGGTADVPRFAVLSAAVGGEGDAVTVTVTAACYHPGTWELFPVDIRDDEGMAVGYRLPAVTVNAVNETGDLADIEPPLALGGNWYRLALVVLAAAVVGALAGFGWRRYRRGKRARDSMPVERTPLERYFDEVGAMDMERMLAAGEYRELVAGLSGAFRRYLSGTTPLDAEEMTSAEIISALKKHMPAVRSGSVADDLAASTRLWDLAKFAEFKPAPELLRENVERTGKLVRRLNAGGGIRA